MRTRLVATVLVGGIVLSATPASAISGATELTIRARSSNKCLDVVGASTSNGARIQQWDCSGSRQQRWKMQPVGNGDYYIVNVNSNKCLDVTDGSRSDGAPLQQWSCNESRQQRFYIYDGERIEPTHSWKCLDVVGGPGATTNGARIQQWTCYDGHALNQWFY